MDVTLEFKSFPHYLLVKGSGQWRERNVRHALQTVHLEAEKQGLTCILIDMRDVSPPANLVTRFFTGVQLATFFKHPYRIAAIGLASWVDHFTETVATNRGAKLKVFTDEQQALAWLLENA